MRRNLGVVKLAVAGITDPKTNQVLALSSGARPEALKYADEQMRKSKDVVLAALRRQLLDGADPCLIYKVAHDDLRANKEFLKEALMLKTGAQQRNTDLWAHFKPVLQLTNLPHEELPSNLSFTTWHRLNFIR